MPHHSTDLNKLAEDELIFPKPLDVLEIKIAATHYNRRSWRRRNPLEENAQFHAIDGGRQFGDQVGSQLIAVEFPRLDNGATDWELMIRVVARDQHAFALLAKRYAHTALGLAQRIVGNTIDAEDVVQESLVRLWVSAYRWRSDRGPLSSWFYRIVRNRSLDHLRHKVDKPVLTIDEPIDSSPGPDEQRVGREIGLAIRRAVDRLPARQRAAILLCHLKGLSCAEAAKATGVSVGTMESLLFRARGSLRKWLGYQYADL